MSENESDASGLRFGAFELDFEARELRRRGFKIKLHDQALQLLGTLARRSGTLVTKEELRRELWPSGTHVDFDHGLHSAITRVREALGDSSGSPRYVETIPRRGYRFIAPVETIAAAGDHDSQPANAVATARVSQSEAARSLVVLPLANLSGDPNDEYVADGLTEELITHLAQMLDLRVISRTTTMHYKGTNKRATEIGRELRADTIVEGSVALSGRQVRVTAQLVDARTDRHIWAARYQRNVEDMFEVQGEMSRAIADEICARIEDARRMPTLPVAPIGAGGQEDYLRGVYLLRRGYEDAIRKAISYLDTAKAKDPTDARVHARIAECYLALDDFYAPPIETMPKAREAAVSALALDDNLAEAHNALGVVRFFYDWDWDGAEREFQRAIRCNPAYSEARSWYAIFLAHLGRRDDAAREITEAERVDPLSPIVRVNGAWVHYLARDNKRALAAWRQALELEPQLAVAHPCLFVAYLPDSGFQRVLDSSGALTAEGGQQPLNLVGLSAHQMLCGNIAEAEKTMRRLRSIARHHYVCRYEMAAAAAMLADKDATISMLKQAYRDRSGCMSALVTDPRFDRVRSDPRFKDLVRKVGLPARSGGLVTRRRSRGAIPATSP